MTHDHESLFAAIDHRQTRRTSWPPQTLVTTPGAEHFGGLSRRSHEVTAGIKHLVRPDLLAEASLLQNLQRRGPWIGPRLRISPGDGNVVARQ